MGVAAGGVAGGVLAAEVCTPLLLLCWLCCWPDDASSDTSSNEMPPKKPVIKSESTSHRRASDAVSGGGGGGGHLSLHLPSTSGASRVGVAAHRSHEEIRSSRRCSHHLTDDDGGRYHSAPSMIEEVLHRRVWERCSQESRGWWDARTEGDGAKGSTSRDEGDGYVVIRLRSRSRSDDSLSQEESTQVETSFSNNVVSSPRPCKKHHTNTKNQKKKLTNKDNKDEDLVEKTSFYIGDDADTGVSGMDVVARNKSFESSSKTLYKAKEAKQLVNECIRSKQPLVRVCEYREVVSGWSDVLPVGGGEGLEVERDSARHGERDTLWETCEGLEVERDGARHGDTLRETCSRATIASVEPVGYEGAACYLCEGETTAGDEAGGWSRGRGTGRHASDGDILATPRRPESGAFSESELELEIELAGVTEEPPPYCDSHYYSCQEGRKETAI